MPRLWPICAERRPSRRTQKPGRRESRQQRIAEPTSAWTSSNFQFSRWCLRRLSPDGRLDRADPRWQSYRVLTDSAHVAGRRERGLGAGQIRDSGRETRKGRSACCEKASTDENDETGNIVLGAPRAGRLHNGIGGGLRVGVLYQHLFELVDGDAFHNTVGAEHKPIAVSEREDFRIGPGSSLFGADVAPQHVLKAMCAGFVWGDCSRVNERLRQGVVLSQLFQFPVAEPERGAVTDAAHIEPVGDAEHKDNRRPHFAKLGIDLAEGHDFDIGVAERLVDLFADLVRRVLLEVQLLLEMVGDVFDGHFARLFAGGLSAHAVSDDEIAPLRVGKAAILIVLAVVARDASQAPAQLHVVYRTDRMLSLTDARPARVIDLYFSSRQ